MPDTTTRILQRLLDEPHHVAAVRSLEPHRFDALVRQVGLEDAGELMAMATPTQTLAVLDQALWRDDGPQARLDAERFAVWLEVLLEGGDALVAQRLAALPEALLTAALSQQLFVLELDALGHAMAGSSWDEAAVAERVLDECLYLELHRYTLVARYGLGWDPTIAALLALDRFDHERVERLLEQCRLATIEELELEDDGLHTILRAQQTLEEDARADRDDRRARAGYVSKADAMSFLALAELTPLDVDPEDPQALAEDPVTRAHLRELAAPTPPSASSKRSAAALEAGSSLGRRSSSPSLRALVEHLDALDGIVASGKALGADDETVGTVESPSVTRLRRALQALHGHDPSRHAQQLMRLVHLANVLMAAGHPDGTAYAPLDASREVLAVAARGLDHWRAACSRHGNGVFDPLDRIGVDGLFRLGWRLRADHETDHAPAHA